MQGFRTSFLILRNGPFSESACKQYKARVGQLSNSNIMPCNAMQCNTMQCNAMQCNTVRLKKKAKLLVALQMAIVFRQVLKGFLVASVPLWYPVAASSPI